MNSQDYVNELFNLEGHVGIVTGASRGLGMGIAQVLTNAGATVYNLDIIERSDEKEITGNMIDIHADRVIALLHPDQILMEPGHRADDGLREKE